MEINKEIYEILKESKIDKDAGILVLLGIYFKVDVDTVCPEEVIKAINTTHIVDKDYSKNNRLIWNVPLFQGQVTEWAWVRGYNDSFGKINPSRKDALKDVENRMIEFFKRYPQYRVEDIKRATLEYQKTVKDAQYLKSSAKFIFDGIGALKKSMLLTWCERFSGGTNDFSGQKGRVVT